MSKAIVKQIDDLIRAYLKDTKQVMLWYTTPNQYLGMLTPLDFIKQRKHRKLLTHVKKLTS